MVTNEMMKEVEYAGFWKRVLAFILDMIVLSPVLFFYMKYYKYFVDNKIVLPVLLYTILSYSFQVFFDVKYGGTPGKLIAKVRIVNSDGQYITILQSIWRLSPQLVANILFIIGHFFISSEGINRVLSPIENVISYFYFIDVLVIVFNKKKRAIHDYIANTYVVTKQSLQNVEGNFDDLA
jgi:uncharacterized RDD family membrane protein YckC